MSFETEFTYHFIKRSLPLHCARILEIGCGSGELARRLAEDGFALTAIDNDSEALNAARRLGVQAHLAAWPEFEAESADAILFTRSLHHIHPLDQAVTRARDSLTDGGRIIVEDFAYDSADEKTLRWFAKRSRELKTAGLLVNRGELIQAMIEEGASMETWRQHHDHNLHSSEAIAAELASVAKELVTEEAPYYFRYLAAAMASTTERDRIGRRLAEEEATLIFEKAIVPLGRRFVAICG